MTQKLSSLFNLDEIELNETIENTADTEISDEDIDQVLGVADKINRALPQVKGLDSDDKDFDDYAKKAMETYDKLVDLGMNVDDRNAGAIFDVATRMMANAISAKSAKLDKKLKMIDLQLKKANLDLKIEQATKSVSERSLGLGPVVEAEGTIVTDRNSLLKEIMQQLQQSTDKPIKTNT